MNREAGGCATRHQVLALALASGVDMIQVSRLTMVEGDERLPRRSKFGERKGLEAGRVRVRWRE